MRKLFGQLISIFSFLSKMWTSIALFYLAPQILASGQGLNLLSKATGQVMGKWSANFQAFLMYSFARSADSTGWMA